MLRAIEVRAPVRRNQAVMEFWFDVWNADNERARAAYEALRARQDKPNEPRPCKSGEHTIPADDKFCRPCRSKRERRQRASGTKGPKRTRITEAIRDEAVRLYLEEKLSIYSTAVHMGLAESTVRDILNFRGVVTRSLSEARLLMLSRKNAPGGNAA